MVLMTSAVCGRAPPEKDLAPPQPFLFPPPPPLPRVSQDWLSVTNTRTLPSLGSGADTGAAGAAVSGTVSSIAATTFDETPDFFRSSKSASVNWKSHVPCLIRAIMMSSSKPSFGMATTRALVIFADEGADCVVAGVEAVTATGCSGC